MTSTIVYSNSYINDKINKTTQSHISVYVNMILEEFESFLKTGGAIGKTTWTYEFECNPMCMEALNIELKKHFDKTVFVHIYGGVARDSVNKHVCQINWGAD